MEKYYLLNHYTGAEEGFKIIDIESIQKDYITFNQMQELTKKADTTLYYSATKYNQTLVLKRFIELLHNQFNDRLYINSKYLKPINIIMRYNNINGSGIYEDKNFIAYTSDIGTYMTFAIDDYIYYISFDENPFFISDITTKKIFKFDDKVIYNNIKNTYFIKDYYGGARKEYNISNLIDDIWAKECNIEKAANNLYNYFIENCFQNESLRARGKNERIFTLNGKDYNIITLTGKEYF